MTERELLVDCLRRLKDVILHKLFWNRMTPSERQCQDAAGIVAVQSGKLDEAYLRHWAGQLDVLPMLEELLSGRIKPKTT